MKIIRSKVLGFCMGVRRAVEMTVTAASHKNSKCVFTFGPLVHNPKVLENLKSQGVEILDPSNIEYLFRNSENCTLVIRAHGIEPKIEEDLKSRGVEVIDATCPNVKKSQLAAKYFSEKGYKLFLAGDPEHAEITSICGYAKSSVVVSNAAEAETAAKKLHETDKDSKTAVIAQTTITEEEYNSIVSAVKKYFPDIEVIQSICGATKDRQDALRELIEQVEAVIIVGGKESANTSRLFSIAEESGLPCVQVENAAEIPLDFHNYNTIGLSAGASTPDSIIDEVEMEVLK